MRELKAFQRIALEPGEGRTVRFEVSAQQLGFIGRAMQYVVEPGEFEVWIGPDSERGVRGEFQI